LDGNANRAVRSNANLAYRATAADIWIVRLQHSATGLNRGK